MTAPSTGIIMARMSLTLSLADTVYSSDRPNLTLRLSAKCEQSVRSMTQVGQDPPCRNRRPPLQWAEANATI